MWIVGIPSTTSPQRMETVTLGPVFVHRPCGLMRTVRDPLSSQKDRGWRSKVIAQRALQNFNILKQEASARKHSIV